MKKTIILLLCTIILFNAGGYYLAYFQVQSYFKNLATGRINEYIALENLTLIKSNFKNIKKEEQKIFTRINDHEVSQNGKMYDVYKEETIGDTLVLYCLSDENEDKLDLAFSEYINKIGADMMNVPVKSLLKSLIKIALPPVEFAYNDYSLSNLIAFKSQYDLINVIIDVSVPPPRSV